MKNILKQLYADDVGFIVSAELVLIATIVVLGMITGLSEVAHGINQELEDVGSAFGAVNQSYEYSGSYGHKGKTVGSQFGDHVDFCDSQWDISCDQHPVDEYGKNSGY